MTSGVRVGLAGCGRLAERGYVPALAACPAAELVAVTDVELARCAAVAPGVPAFASVGALLREAEVDLVIVATPVRTHLEIATAAAGHGCRTLVEKPPASDASGAWELAALEPVPWVGFNRRFDPSIAGLREQARSTSGLELRLEMAILPDAWDARERCDSPLLDLGPHLVDLALWLGGRHALAVRSLASDGGAVRFELQLDDARAVIAVSHARAWYERLEVWSGSRRLGGIQRGGTWRRALGRLSGSRQSPLVASLTAQLGAASAAVRGEPVDDRLAPAAAGATVMEVLDAVAAGARRPGVWIDVPGARSAACSH